MIHLITMDIGKKKQPVFAKVKGQGRSLTKKKTM
jgi:hypothetical protein